MNEFLETGMNSIGVQAAAVILDTLRHRGVLLDDGRGMGISEMAKIINTEVEKHRHKQFEL